MVHYLDMHRILHLYTFLMHRGSAKASTGMMSIYLNPSYAESVTLDYKFVLKDKNGMVYDELSSNGIIFCGTSKGSSNWVSREEVLDSCIDDEGVLTVECHMRRVGSQIASIVHKGLCPMGFDVFTISIPRFGSLARTAKDVFVDSPTFMCFGQEWKFKLFPGGYGTAKAGMMSILLVPVEAKRSITLDYKYLIRDKSGRIFDVLKHNDVLFSTTTLGRGPYDYIKYEQIISSSNNVLVNGALTIELHARVSGCQKSSVLPKNPFKENLQVLCLENTPDVTFEVSGTNGTSRFSAHRSVLKLYAPTLAELCGDEGGTTVHITDVEPCIFRSLLQYVYGGSVSLDDLKAHSKEFIHASNKYDVTNLKLEAEAAFLDNHKFTADDVMETFLYADAKDLALMKEAAGNFIYENADEMIASNAFKGNASIDPIMLKELLSVVASKNVEKCGTKHAAMSVSTLRKKLLDKGLDIDGSREALISRLEG